MSSDQLRETIQATLSGTYVIERELDAGGMSRVFVAEEVQLGRQVVLKVLAPDLAHGINAERFAREIHIAAALQHANIVPVLTAGEVGGLPYYTMPLVEGESLRRRMQRGPMHVQEVVGVLRDVARALSCAHQHGIVHRDIKPDNVLLSGGVALVTDFGIAKAIEAARGAPTPATLTQTGVSVGTPAYMAPEQVAGERDTDHRADLYALGATAYEMLTGQMLFGGRTPAQMAAAHLSATPRPIAAVRDDVPAPLADLVTRCLAKDPSDRPQSAEELQLLLDTIAAQDGSGVARLILSRRKQFWMALGIYALAIMAVALAAQAAIVRIGLPDWAYPGALVIMALGLPAILWTGFVHQVSRHALGETPAPRTRHPLGAFAVNASLRPTWRRTAVGVGGALALFALAVSGYMAMRAFGIGPAATLFGTGQLKEKDQIIVTDFSATNRDSGMARTVSFAVRTSVAQSKVLRVMDEGRVAAALERMKRPRTSRVDLELAQGLALREGIKGIIDGEVTPLGRGYALSVRLLSADSLRELAAAQASCNGPEGLIQAADKVARALRGKAGESLRLVQNTQPLTLARTASLEALRYYGEGSRANNLERDYPRAIARLRLAVEADSNFAEAWRLLGTVRNNLGQPRSQVDSAFTRAYRLRERLPAGEQDFVVASYYGRGPGRDRVKALEAYERTIIGGALRNNAASLLLTRREFARAESLYRADIVQRANLQLAHEGLVLALANQGKVAAVDSAIAAYRVAFPTSLAPGRLAIAHAYTSGRIEEFARLLDSARAVRDPIEPSRALWGSSQLALLRGQRRKWLAYREQALAADRAIGRLGTSPVTAARAFALVRLSGGDGVAESRALDAILSQSPLRTLPDAERTDLTVAYFLAMAGEPERARAIVREFQATVRDTAVKRDLEPDRHSALGMIALTENRPDEAITEFRLGDVQPDGPKNDCSICLPLEVGRAFDAAKLPDSAIAQYERYVTSPFANRLQEQRDPANLPAIHERLGQLYEAKGDGVRALAHFAAFIELWKNADPELQPRVADARRRVASLTQVERPGR